MDDSTICNAIMFINRVLRFFCAIHVFNMNSLIIANCICYFNTIESSNTNTVCYNTPKVISNTARAIAFN